MITDRQRQRDFEYEADYQTKSRWTSQQWTNIIDSGNLDPSFLSLLKEIYASFNHAASLLQLSFHGKCREEEVLAIFNEAGRILGQANDFEPEVDFSGNEYWWYLFFWGRELPDHILEVKLHPELSEACGALFPELEEAYYAFMSEAERSLQIRYSQEDAVWIAAAVLLYEKYYRYPGITPDDILLMHYEVQTRAQKIFGQDVDNSTINVICNADERGHRFNYLRDMYKYYRVAFPGEFDGDRERPDPKDLDYSAFVYSLFGYLRVEEIYDFISHEYAHLVDESYVELENANGFVRLCAFLSRQGGHTFSREDHSESSAKIRTDGADSQETFRLIADKLLEEYPNFSRLVEASWYDEEKQIISPFLEERLYIEKRKYTGAFLAIRTITDGDEVSIESSLHLPWTRDDIMPDIQEKCDKLTLMTTAPFTVAVREAGPSDLKPEGKKLVVSALYTYSDYKDMKEEDIPALFCASLMILASTYTDLCQNYYPAPEGAEDSEVTDQDALRAALGDKLTYRPAAEVAGPDIIYKEGTSNPATDYITKTLQDYARRAEGGSEEEEGQNMAPESISPDSVPNQGKGGSTPSVPGPASPDRTSHTDFVVREKVVKSSHPDRADQTFRLFPKNILIKGPMKTRKFHEAIMTAVGIIEGKDTGTLSLEPVPDILEHFREYEQEGRILHVACPDLGANGYESFIESPRGTSGIFRDFADRADSGRYVVLMEEADLNWRHLFGECSILLRENRREGASSESIVTLRYSGDRFQLPSNLYIVATCDSIVCEDTILAAVDYDFYIHPVSPDPGVLRSMRIEGISLERLMNTMNTRISYFLGPDYQLGEGFFLASAERSAFASLGRAFREQIIPVLVTWFDGDIERIRYVLGDNGKMRADTIFYQELPFKDQLFKGSLPDSFDRERRIYRLNEDAFTNPNSYITVYEG